MDERVSVIMPCYNDGKYIQEAVDSVLSQTYPKIELIIVDDGSDDPDTCNILERLSNNSSIHVLHANHGGPAAARNKAIDCAKGKYILPLDADDKIHPAYIEKAVEAIQSRPDVGIVYCKAELFGERSGPWHLDDFSIGKMLVRNQIFVSALFYKDDWKKSGGFSEQLTAGIEDYDFWLSLLELGKTACRLNETLFYYRIKPQSRTKKFEDNAEAVEHSYSFIYEKHKRLYDDHIQEYVCELRQELNRVERENRALRRGISFINKLNKNPIIHKISVWMKERLSYI